MIWLPFQLALRPEEHDGQSELDQLIGQVTGSEVLPGHDLVYATDERFQAALLRTIQQARDYHVLWIHDFAGKAENDRPDSTSMSTGWFTAISKRETSSPAGSASRLISSKCSISGW